MYLDLIACVVLVCLDLIAYVVLVCLDLKGMCSSCVRAVLMCVELRLYVSRSYVCVALVYVHSSFVCVCVCVCTVLICVSSFYG